MPPSDFAVYPQQMPRLITTDGISVREDLLYTDQNGVEKPAVRKRNQKQLRRLAPALRSILLPDESVLLLAPARSPLTLLEQLTAGWWTAVLARCMVVATNKRVLVFPVKTDGAWRESVRSASWGDVVDVKPKGLLVRCVTFALRNGAKITYANFRRPDAAKLAAIAAAVQLAGGAEQSPALGFAHLCPDCRHVLTAGVYSCSGCGLAFKNEKTMVLRSLLLPGGGYFYTGHPFIAVLPALVEAFLLLEIALLILAGMNRPALMQNVLSALVLLAVIWVLETAVTILHCRRYIREFIPDKRDPSRSYAMAASTSK